MMDENEFYGDGKQRPANEGGRFFPEDDEEEGKEPGGCLGVCIGCGIVLVFATAIALTWILTGA